MMNKIYEVLRHTLYLVLCDVLSLAFLGYGIIFTSIYLFGYPVFLSWQMWAQMVMVSFGGILIRIDGQKESKS